MPEIIPAGDAAVILKFGNEIHADINAAVMRWLDFLAKDAPAGIIDLIPSYCELLILYDPVVLHGSDLLAFLHTLERKHAGHKHAKGLASCTEHEIPVLYNDDAGPDLAEVAAHCRISAEELISLHTSVVYKVYMLGFLPGFCYLGGMDARLAMPRKNMPRLQVLAGSVGIAGMQTGIYPLASPGGWQIIGQTPLKLFDWQRTPAFLISPGDQIRFCRITAEAFNNIMQEIESGSYHHNQKNIGIAD